jgi:hypothetical protein
VGAGVLVAAAILVGFYIVKKGRKRKASRTSQFLMEVARDKGYSSGSSGQQQQQQQELNRSQSNGWGGGGGPAQTPIYEAPGQFPMQPQPPQRPVEIYGKEEKEKWASHEVYEVPG